LLLKYNKYLYLQKQVSRIR